MSQTVFANCIIISNVNGIPNASLSQVGSFDNYLKDLKSDKQYVYSQINAHTHQFTGTGSGKQTYVIFFRADGVKIGDTFFAGN